MSRTIRDYLEDMLSSAKEVIEFTKGMEFQNFRQDRKTINATLRSLEVMGEAAKKIPEQIRVKYPTVPWRDIAGMRDKLIHEYHGVDLNIIWKTIQEEIPPLIPVLEAVLREAT